jgi:hypothetical protein
MVIFVACAVLAAIAMAAATVPAILQQDWILLLPSDSTDCVLEKPTEW